MPPKQKQSQAGKFKPLKRPARKAAAVVEVPSSAAAPPAESGVADGGGDATREGGAADPGGGEGGRASRSRGRGRSRSPRGRGGRGGRGGGRGGRGRGRGRFVVPAGAAFFTGEMAQRAATGGAAASANEGDVDVNMDMGGDEAVVVPAAKAAAKTGSSKAARSTAKSSAAATAREEDEEEIVAEVWDADEAAVTREVKKKAETQQAKKKASRRRTKADAGEGAPAVHNSTGADEAFTYDSDSSMEEDDAGGFPMPPTQLPFPIPLGQATMYDCQDGPEEEKKSSERDAQVASLPTASSRTSDPPVKSPFLNLNVATDEEKKKEAGAWFLMKFPTRLPQLDANSTTAASSKRTAVKSEFGEESGVGGGAHLEAGEGASSRPLGYDDALRHALPGRYGRIVVRRSGRTELVLGGGENGEPEVRMLVHEGLQCGFRQEAVGVDPAGRTFVALGGVDKSLVVTPDVERAFAGS